MSDEKPVDLRSLAVDEPDVVRASIRRFRRRVVVWTLWLLVFAIAGVAISADAINHRDQNPGSLIATEISQNSSLANYQVGPIDVGLLKVVFLPNDQLGLQLVLHSADPLGECCNIFPQASNVTNQGGAGDIRFEEILVVVPRASVSSTGTLDMLLTSRGDPRYSIRLGRFTVDLRALGVHGFGG